MPDDPSPIADPKVRQFADAVAYALMHGKSVDEVVSDLVQEGWRREDALPLVTKIDEACRAAENARMARAALRKAPLIHFVLGALWCVAGGLLIATSTEQRDLSPLGVASVVFGAAQMGWAWRSHRLK
jgi:hypothetical protein